MSATEWTTPDDLRRQVQRHWESGRLLAAAITGESLFPLELRLRGPDTRALSERFEEVRQWIRELESESRCQIEWREINHRLLGRNRVPARIVVPGEREALELIAKTDDAARFRALAGGTLERLPGLRAWVAPPPRRGPLPRPPRCRGGGKNFYRGPKAAAGGTARSRAPAGGAGSGRG